MDIRVEPVTTRRQLSDFIGLPARLYAGMPGWVPPLIYERVRLLHPKKAPFFRGGEAQYFLARRGDDLVGRISAQFTHEKPAGGGETGLFGCIDAVDEAKVTEALLAEARRWLKERGFKRILGPFNLSINGETGLMIEGHGEPPTPLIPWSPPFLQRHLEGAGLTKAKDVISLYFDEPRVDQWRIRDSKLRGDELVSRWADSRIVVRSLDFRHLKRESEIIADVFNDAWHDNWGFLPISPSDIAALLHGYRAVMKPEFGAVIEVEGKPAAISVAVPNLNDLTYDFGGRLGPVKVAKGLLRYFRGDMRSHRLLLFGVRRAFHRSLMGSRLSIISMNAVYRSKVRIDRLEIGWILEDNRPVLNVVEKASAKPSKRHRVYAGDID